MNFVYVKTEEEKDGTMIRLSRIISPLSLGEKEFRRRTSVPVVSRARRCSASLSSTSA